MAYFLTQKPGLEVPLFLDHVVEQIEDFLARSAVGGILVMEFQTVLALSHRR